MKQQELLEAATENQMSKEQVQAMLEEDIEITKLQQHRRNPNFERL